MTIQLRPHHLLCMLTYVGKGYGVAFIENYDAVIRRMRDGEPVTIVAGPDDVCAPLAAGRGAHCHRASVLGRDGTAAREVGALLGISIAPGTELRIDADLLSTLRAAFRAGRIRAACAGCEWTGLCTDVAQANFPNARLQA
jgi:uncharacterized protein